MLGNDVALSIVGNKIDLEKDRRVTMKVAEEYAKSVNAKLYHTSAKLNKGIEELFNDLAQRKFKLIKRRSRIFLFVLGMLEKTPQTPTADSNVRSGGVPFQVTPTPDQNNEKKSGTCC
jgi:GTPase SAR1 family protein